MQLHDHRVALAFHCNPTHRTLDAPDDRLRRKDSASSMTHGACLGHVLQVALSHALPRHLDETEVAHSERSRARAVAAEMCSQLLKHLVAIAARLHVDEISD